MIKTTVHNLDDFVTLVKLIKPHHAGYTRDGQFTALSPDERHILRFNMRNILESTVRRLVQGEDMSFGSPNAHGNYSYHDSVADVRAKVPEPNRCVQSFSLENKTHALRVLILLGADKTAAKTALNSVSITALRKRTDTSDPENVTTETYSLEIVKDTFKGTFTTPNRPDSVPYDPEVVLSWENESYTLTLTYRDAFRGGWAFVYTELQQAGIPMIEGEVEFVKV